MRFVPYQSSDLQFAYCYRIYLRFRTHAATRIPQLAEMTREIVHLAVEPMGVHVLELSADSTDCLCLLSLRPEDSVSAAVSKVKGQVSKWLRSTTGVDDRERLLSRGYFAMTTGKSTVEAVAAYLDGQGTHHGYDGRWAQPPVFVKSCPTEDRDEWRLQAAHCQSLLRLHCVLATWRRVGVFSPSLAAAVTDAWREWMQESPFTLEKVSVVPDHVHLAVRVHPSVSPAELIGTLMNQAQSIAERAFEKMVRPPAVERLWQPSAYLGSFGELASPQVAAYLRSWQAAADKQRELPPGKPVASKTPVVPRPRW